MIDAVQLQPLRDRRAQIAKRASELEVRAEKIAKEKAALDAEVAAIDTTLETLAKIYGVEVEQPATKTRTHVSTKPDNTPTMYDMVEQILSEYSLLGIDFVEGHEIYEEIRKRWWPDAPRNSIIPSLHRFEREQRLLKAGTKYGLPIQNEALGGQTPSASEPEWDIDDEPF